MSAGPDRPLDGAAEELAPARAGAASGRDGHPALIWCPFGSEEEAALVAGTLLDERLVACANIVPGIRSLYVWNGVRGEGREHGVLFKTDGALLARAVARLTKLHSYEQPAVIGWMAAEASAATRAWLADVRAEGLTA